MLRLVTAPIKFQKHLLNFRDHSKKSFGGYEEYPTTEIEAACVYTPNHMILTYSLTQTKPQIKQSNFQTSGKPINHFTPEETKIY